MLFWILIIIVLVVVVIFAIKSITSKNGYANSENRASDFRETTSPHSAHKKKSSAKNLKAMDVLPNVEKIKENAEFNWLKLHQNINPAKNSAIEEKLTKLIRDEREYIIIDKFIYFTKLHPNYEILQILDEVEKTALSYKEILSRSGNK